MKNFLKAKAWPVVAGLVTAFVIMSAFEFANSLLYPLPQGLDIYDTVAVRAFTAALPWTAYILVFLGWVAGAFAAGLVATRLSRERAYRLSLVVGILLTIAGVANNIMIGHDTFFTVVGLPMFIICTYLGHRYAARTLPRVMDDQQTLRASSIEDGGTDSVS